MKEALQILLVEDNPGDARIVQEFLKEESLLKFNLHRAESLSEGLKILSNTKIDIILSDLGLPDSQGIATFYSLVKSATNIPIILFTGMNDNELGLIAVKMGAEDYLIKGQVGQQLLIRSINYAIERKKAENRQKLISRILLILNRPNEWHKIIKDILYEIKEFSGIEAVAIRIHKDDDYPYMDTFGFSPEFIETEKSLCIKDMRGNVVFDPEGKPVLACMCGNVISGRTDSKQPFFTQSGSFWTNSTTALLTSTTEKERQGNTRNRCNRDGYESVALIPVISGKETIGLIQLNDKRTDCFTLEMITFFEEIASTVGIAYKRVNIEKQIKESKERYKKLFDNDISGNFIKKPNGEILMCNAAFAFMFGFLTVEEITGVDMGELYSDPNDRNLILKELHSKGRIEDFELWMKRKDGKQIHVIENTFGSFNDQGELIEITGYIFNDTERNKAEAALKSALEKAQESDRLKSAFLANISHEFRTPLNGILGFLELLKEPDLTGEQKQDYFSIIEKSSARILNTVSDIVDLSKIESAQMEVTVSEINVNQKIKDIYVFFKPEAEQTGLQLSYTSLLPDHAAILKTDKNKLLSILSNLVSNAIKFSKTGSIEIGCNIVEKLDQASLRFYVKDTGIGIRPDQKEYIFERFRQGSESLNKKYQGAGMGLSIAKSYVEMLGGKIWVESEVGLGSTFYFTLPYRSETIETTVTTITNPNALTYHEDNRKIKLKILIVEDDESSKKFLTIMVQFFGKEIIHASTGVEGVKACLNNPDIDLVLMDIQMPEMDGYEATRQIRKFNTNVVIIAQTAYALAGDREKAIEAGCNDYISKPVNRNELLNMLGKYFN